MDDGICPPWWPNFLWWLIHHPPHNRQPFYDKGEKEEILQATQHVLIALQTFASAQFSEGSVRAEVQEHALEKLKQGVEELSGIAARPTATVA